MKSSKQHSSRCFSNGCAFRCFWASTVRQGREICITLSPAPNPSSTLHPAKKNEFQETHQIETAWWCKNVSQNWKSSPNRGENKEYLKPAPNRIMVRLHLRSLISAPKSDTSNQPTLIPLETLSENSWMDVGVLSIKLKQDL